MSVRIALVLAALLAAPTASARVGVRIETPEPQPFLVQISVGHFDFHNGSWRRKASVIRTSGGWSNVATGVQVPLVFLGARATVYHPAYVPERAETKSYLALLRPTSFATFRPRRWEDVLEADEPPTRYDKWGPSFATALDQVHYFWLDYLPAMDDAGLPVDSQTTRAWFGRLLTRTWERASQTPEDSGWPLRGPPSYPLGPDQAEQALSKLDAALALTPEQRRHARWVQARLYPKTIWELLEPRDRSRLEADLDADAEPRTIEWRRREVDYQLDWDEVRGSCTVVRLFADARAIGGAERREPVAYGASRWCRGEDGTWEKQSHWTERKKRPPVPMPYR
jgi:hypothetical protein